MGKGHPATKGVGLPSTPSTVPCGSVPGSERRNGRLCPKGWIPRGPRVHSSIFRAPPTGCLSLLRLSNIADSANLSLTLCALRACRFRGTSSASPLHWSCRWVRVWVVRLVSNPIHILADQRTEAGRSSLAKRWHGGGRAPLAERMPLETLLEFPSGAVRAVPGTCFVPCRQRQVVNAAPSGSARF